MVEALLEDVESRARTALLSSPIFALRGLSVERYGDSLLVSGTVGSFYHKQMAQEMVRAVSKGHRVVNTVEVEYAENLVGD